MLYKNNLPVNSIYEATHVSFEMYNQQKPIGDLFEIKQVENDPLASGGIVVTVDVSFRKWLDPIPTGYSIYYFIKPNQYNEVRTWKP